MNYSLIVKTIGRILIVEALLMLIPFFISVYNGNTLFLAFLFAVVITLGFGILLNSVRAKNQRLRIVDGMAIVTFGWLLVSIFGALPYLFSGFIVNPIDALFESVSGFSTTGATILTHVEMLPQSLMFWRSFTQWIGGMGILVFTLAFLPVLEGGNLNVFKAEASSSVSDKMTPRVKDNARVLYLTYGMLTLVLTILLFLGGMDLFEALLHAFGTIATAGFSTRSGGIAAFDSAYIHWVIAIFMLLSGVNFALLISIARGQFKRASQNSEFRYYLSIIVLATLALTLSIGLQNHNVMPSIKDGFFLAVSIVTTTGFTTLNINQLPYFSQAVLLVLMFVGGCVGSTGSGVKAYRGLVVFKLVRREIVKMFHPRAVVPILISQKKVNSESIHSVVSFVALYIMMFVGGALIISLDHMDLIKSFSAAAAALGNIGQSFGFDSVAMNYSGFSGLSKLVMCVLMLIGRLELFTVLALLAPRSWKKGT